MQKKQPGVGNSSTSPSETQGKNISQVSKEAKLFIEATKLIPPRIISIGTFLQPRHQP